MSVSSRRVNRLVQPPLEPRHGLDAVRVVVLPAEVGASVRDVLVARFPALVSPSAQDLSERFARGEFVDQNARPYGELDLAERGREIYFHRELRPETVEAIPIPVVFEDEHVLVVAKPRGMASIPRGEHILRSALIRLRVEHDNACLSPIHRLDKQTGGILVLSKKPEERGAYQTMFASREIYKRYVAIVEPHGAVPTLAALELGPIDIREPISKQHGDLWAHVDPDGKPAWTTAALASPDQQRRALGGVRGGGGRRLLDLTPHTGRTHQLRVHLSHVGLPIVGDELYPAPAPDPVSGERRRRDVGEPLALWSVAMSFTDPLTGIERNFEWDPFGEGEEL